MFEENEITSLDSFREAIRSGTKEEQINIAENLIKDDNKGKYY